MRILFLDDDPARALAFAAARPDAVWVKTAGECLALLGQGWDEVHLDHDLGGETYVDHERDDCGMAVVRSLCEEIRDHLKRTRFVIHSHNPNAACMMAFQLQVMGYQVEVRPFGHRSQGSPRGPGKGRGPAWLGRRLLGWLRG